MHHRRVGELAVRVVRVLLRLEVGVDRKRLGRGLVVLLLVLFLRERLACAVRTLVLRWLLLLLLLLATKAER